MSNMTPRELQLDDSSDTIANGVVVAWAVFVLAMTLLVLSGGLDGTTVFYGIGASFWLMVGADVYIRHIIVGDAEPTSIVPSGDD